MSTGGSELFEGMTPPRIAIVEGGIKTVVCSCRAKRGMGAKVFQEGVGFGECNGAALTMGQLAMKSTIEIKRGIMKKYIMDESRFSNLNH